MTTPEESQPAGEANLQQKFFRYFQHEVTGKSATPVQSTPC